MVREALRHHRIEAVLTCHRDGEEMLRYIDQIASGDIPCPDLVLLDLNLPRYNGQAILARLRHSPVCADVPVIVVTSSRASKEREAVMKLGATKYFHKSMDYDEAMNLGAIVLEVTHRTGSES